MNINSFTVRCPAPRRAKGFTLIELMIVVAIVAILAMVAMPSYESYLRKSRRADAQSFVQEVVARQQHFLLDRRAYGNDITTATTASPAGLGMTIPTQVSSYYTIALTTDNTSSPPSFELTATPTGKQATDACGKLTINHLGVKTAVGTGTCW